MTRTDYFASVLLALVATSEIRARLRARKIGAGSTMLTADGTAPAPITLSRSSEGGSSLPSSEHPYLDAA